MTQILERLLAFGEFEVTYFGDDVIQNQPVEAWPLCDWCDALQAPLRHCAFC
jgi:hypothetical protein